MGIKITGLGAAVPNRKVTNDDLAKTLDTSDEWITTRTGIKTRHYASVEQTTSYLAAEAGRAAIESQMSSSKSTKVDALVVATTTADRLCPATAPKVAAKLGLGHVTAFDVNAACSGFIYGLTIAESLVRSGQARKVMLIGADVFSAILDPNDRSTYPLFGDAAGAIILEHDPSQNHLVATNTGSDGEGYDLLTIKAGGSESKLQDAVFDEQDHYFAMDGKTVFVRAIAHMKQSVVDLLAAQQLTTSDIDCLVPHQANIRIINTLVALFDLDEDKALLSLREFGNTSAASIPLTLTKTCMEGGLQPNDKVVVTAFGGGLTWGAGLLIWPESPIKANIIFC